MLISIIFLKLSSSRLAPPIKNPFTSSQEPISNAFFALTLPPYKRGSAEPTNSFVNVFKNLCVSLISSIEALIPVLTSVHFASNPLNPIQAALQESSSSSDFFYLPVFLQYTVLL